MAKKERAAARKIKDKWKAKSWYTLVAPEMFNKVPLGETPSDDPSKLLGRVTEVTVQDLTGDFSKMHIKVQFKAKGIRGSEVDTHFMGHDMTSDYIRRLTRRKRSRIDAVVDVATKDGSKVRIKPMAITDRRVQSSKQSAVRNVMKDVVTRTAANSTLGDLVRAIISGELAKNIAQGCKPIQPLFKVEIRRSEVTALGAEGPAQAIETAPARAEVEAGGEVLEAEAQPASPGATAEESEEIREEETEELAPEESEELEEK
jgi:small subunit ribosomal protein S3Ae